VITDFMMPVMDGLEFARAVRQRPAFADLPVFLMSGAQGSIGRASPDLFNVVFDKPFDINKVIFEVVIGAQGLAFTKAFKQAEAVLTGSASPRSH